SLPWRGHSRSSRRRQSKPCLLLGLGLLLCNRLRGPIGAPPLLDLLGLVDDGLGDQLGVLDRNDDPVVVVLQSIPLLSHDDIAERVFVHGNAAIGSQHNVAVVGAPAVIAAPHRSSPWRAASAGSAKATRERSTY